jgi:hypothetical protein
VNEVENVNKFFWMNKIILLKTLTYKGEEYLG